MIITLLFVLGLLFGSFINALVWRLQQQDLPKKKRPNVDVSISKGRSVCVHCKHQLHAIDLVPVLSWVSLRGKCRYCKEHIAWQYPLVELLLAVLFVVSFIFWPLTITSTLGVVKFAIWLAMLVTLVALALYDLKTMLLPDKLVAWLAGFVLLDFALKLTAGLSSAIFFSAVVGLISYGGLFYVLYQVSDGRWIGGGDVKLGFVLGFYLANWQLSLLSIFLASLIGLVMVVPSIISGKHKAMSTQIPFGPMLIGSFFITVLFGQGILSWYFTLLLAQ